MPATVRTWETPTPAPDGTPIRVIAVEIDPDRAIEIARQLLNAAAKPASSIKTPGPGQAHRVTITVATTGSTHIGFDYLAPVSA